MRRLAPAVVAALLGASCSASKSGAPAPSEGAGAPETGRGRAVALQGVPEHAVKLCLSMRRVREACPRLVPRTKPYSAREIERPGLGYTTFNMEAGTSYSDSVRDRPPSFVHLVVEGGELASALAVLVYAREKPVSPEDGLLDSRERQDALSANPPRALYLGRRTWSGKRGDMVLAPPYANVTSIHGGHLLFLWREGESAYVLSLHAWEPFPETERTLKRIVESIP